MWCDVMWCDVTWRHVLPLLVPHIHQKEIIWASWPQVLSLSPHIYRPSADFQPTKAQQATSKAYLLWNSISTLAYGVMTYYNHQTFLGLGEGQWMRLTLNLRTPNLSKTHLFATSSWLPRTWCTIARYHLVSFRYCIHTQERMVWWHYPSIGWCVDVDSLKLSLWSCLQGFSKLEVW